MGYEQPHCGKWKARNGFHFRNLRYAAKFLLTRVTNEIKGVSWLHIWQREQNICPCWTQHLNLQASHSQAHCHCDDAATTAELCSLRFRGGRPATTGLTFIPCPHRVLRPHLNRLTLSGLGLSVRDFFSTKTTNGHFYNLLTCANLCQKPHTLPAQYSQLI